MDPNAPKTSNSRLLWILGGVFGVGLLLCCGGGAAFYFGIRAVLDRAAQPVQAHIDRVRAGQWEAAHADWSADLQAKHTVDELKRMADGDLKNLYRATALTWNHVSVSNGVTRLEGSATGPDGIDRPVQAVLTEEHGQARIARLQVGVD